MGHNKSKHLSLHENDVEIRRNLRLEHSKEDRRRRRKWRKKQGYSLPTGLDMVGKISAASSQPDLPDIETDDAILVSYSKSNAERFSHLRPAFQRRASSEEPSGGQKTFDLELSSGNENYDKSEQHVHVIHVNDVNGGPRMSPHSGSSSVSSKRSVVNIGPEQVQIGPEKTQIEPFSSKFILSEEDEILNVIQDSFKSQSAKHGLLSKGAPSPKLDPEDLDILNSIVPEPSLAIPDSNPGNNPDFEGPDFKEEPILDCEKEFEKILSQSNFSRSESKNPDDSRISLKNPDNSNSKLKDPEIDLNSVPKSNIYREEFNLNSDKDSFFKKTDLDEIILRNLEYERVDPDKKSKNPDLLKVDNFNSNSKDTNRLSKSSKSLEDIDSKHSPKIESSEKTREIPDMKKNPVIDLTIPVKPGEEYAPPPSPYANNTNVMSDQIDILAQDSSMNEVIDTENDEKDNEFEIENHAQEALEEEVPKEISVPPTEPISVEVIMDDGKGIIILHSLTKFVKELPKRVCLKNVHFLENDTHRTV